MITLDMILPLPEYRVIRRLRESSHSRVYEAESRSDGSRVVAKVFDLERAEIEDRVIHEFELIEALDVDGVVKARELRRIGDQLVLVLEHVAGVDLGELADGQPLELSRFWPIALQVAEILAQTHARKVIHRDIKPTNVLVDDRGRVYLADFGISVLLESERRHLHDDSVLIGTLPYIAPEQTGRTNRSVDFRSDLYSLGVTFYQLLTGRLPFESSAPLELIHAHLARSPEPPASLRPELPDALSRLVLRLLAKAPEQRYQTAFGLAADLRRIRALSEAGLDSADFELGLDDRSGRLRWPHRLYGREREQAVLLDEYKAAVTSASRRAVLLVGPVGIGKTALTGVLEAPVTGDGGLLVRGRFDATRELPYSGFVEILEALVDQLLTESEATMARARARLREGLGGLAPVACELVPALELILGDQGTGWGPGPPRTTERPVELGVIEARNRLQITVERLLAALCEPGRALVLAFDELGQADRASLTSIETLLHGVGGPLLIVATLRRDSSDHPAHELEHHPSVRTLTLEPLTTETIQQLLADTLARPLDEVEGLAQIVAHKSGGVPLFMAQLLDDLVERELLAVRESVWAWDESAVAAAEIPDDAVAMMQAKLALLGSEARDLLARAACLGSRFDLGSLALLSDQPRARLATTCYELVELGLLADLGAEYRFPHDSLRIAAQRELADEQRRTLHWTIGRQRLAELGDGGEELFAVVDHLRAGAADDLDTDSRIELANLELRAGRRALGSAAYELALRYLDHGIDLLAEIGDGVAEQGLSAPHYELVFGLHFARAQALALAHERERANQAFATLLGWQLADHHLGQVIASRVQLLFVEGRSKEAVELGLAAMQRWGYSIPPAPARPRAAQSLVRAWWRLRRLDREAMLGLPSCADERAAAIIDVVAQLKYPAFTTHRTLFIYLAGLHARLVARHGLHPTSPVALADLAMGVGVGLGKAEDANALIERAFELADRLPNPAAARLGVVVPGAVMVLHRRRPFAEIPRMLEANLSIALEHGEFERASFMAAFSAAFAIETGTHLRVVHRRTVELGRELARWGTKPMAMHVWTTRCWCLTLLGEQAETEDGDARDARTVSAELVHERSGAATTVCTHLTNVATLHLLLGDRKRALGDLKWFAQVHETLRNTWVIARALLVVIVAAEGERLFGEPVAPRARSIARDGLRLLGEWAELGPDSYGHYHELALGLRSAAGGRFEPAVEQLERAWAGARSRSCHWIEGLAAEYLAHVLERRDMNLLAPGAWQRAWAAHAAWGATAKLDQLRSARPELFEEPSGFARGQGHLRSRSSTPTGERSSTPSLDLAEILRSVGVINEELGLEAVIGRVLDAARTSAGADHGMLVLERDGEFAVVATCAGESGPSLIPGQLRLRDAGARAPSSLINFVVRTHQWLVLDDARADPRFAADPYLFGNDVRSVLALPLTKGERMLGALVLENRQTTHGFTSAIIETLRLITGQAASILDNARLYAALRRSEARWRSLVDGAPDVIALLDEAGKVAFANRRGPFFDLDAGDGDPEATACWQQAVALVLEQGQTRELELALESGSERPSWYAIRIAPIDPDGEGSRRNAVAVATDISARKRVEAEKHTLELQLRQQQRLESIGTLAAGVAHEINNPIQGILNYAELIALRSGEAALVEEFAHEITKESDRVASIVRNLLAFSRQEAERQVEVIEIGRLIASTLSLIHAILRKDHIVLVNAPGNRDARVECRPQQIQQILMNLITNARDAINQQHELDEAEDRKRISLAVERVERGGRAWVRVTVEDTGAGIPESVLPHIFDPFFTTKGRDQGTGLGLAVSHGLASDNGGELTVETRLGEGTRFILDLPEVLEGGG